MVVEVKALDIFQVGPCNDAHNMGLQIGQRFSKMIRSRVANDLILKNQLRPFAQSKQSQPLIEALTSNNRNRYPNYWDEMVGLAQGSQVDFLDIILINFRKEILPFVPKTELGGHSCTVEISDDCSDVLVVGDHMALAVHNEDANEALIGHTYLINGHLMNGHSFIAYTYAGELPSCAYGFNSHGFAFTLNSVPPVESEIAAGGIGRNLISRDLLEATSIEDALCRIRSSQVSVGHNYNLIETRTRRIVNVETASRNRVSAFEIGPTPYFHANMYLNLQVDQVQDENSITRQRKVAELPKTTKDDFLAILGNSEDKKYPIYMSGPTLYTLCTAVIDMDEQTLSIIHGNPQNGQVSHVFDMSSKECKLIKQQKLEKTHLQSCNVSV